MGRKSIRDYFELSMQNDSLEAFFRSEHPNASRNLGPLESSQENFQTQK